jgi:hypothetical protein
MMQLFRGERYTTLTRLPYLLNDELFYTNPLMRSTTPWAATRFISNKKEIFFSPKETFLAVDRFNCEDKTSQQLVSNIKGLSTVTESCV